MGNSESFDLINISDLKNSTPTTRKKHATHHQHSQSISSSVNSITSFDLNGIFRRLSDDNTDFRAFEKSNATAAKDFGQDEISKSESPEPIAISHNISLSSDSDYVEKIETHIKGVDMPLANNSLASLSKNANIKSDEEDVKQVQLTDATEIIKKVETVEVVILHDDDEDIIALDDKEHKVDKSACVLDNLESESESRIQEPEIESVKSDIAAIVQAECTVNKCFI